MLMRQDFNQTFGSYISGKIDSALQVEQIAQSYKTEAVALFSVDALGYHLDIANLDAWAQFQDFDPSNPECVFNAEFSYSILGNQMAPYSTNACPIKVLNEQDATCYADIVPDENFQKDATYGPFTQPLFESLPYLFGPIVFTFEVIAFSLSQTYVV